jgi:hypothetical protein
MYATPLMLLVMIAVRELYLKKQEDDEKVVF